MAGPMGRMMAGTGPEHRSLDFKVSGRRLVARFKPERLTIYVLLLCVVLSVGLSVIGPKILGKATDLVFAGIVGREMEPGATKEQVLEGMRDRGDGDVADMLRSTDFTPGEGIDFTAVGHVLLLALAVFTVAGLLMAVATRLVNRAVNRTETGPTSTSGSAARSSPGPPTTSTTSGRRSSSRWASSSTRCSPSSGCSR